MNKDVNVTLAFRWRKKSTAGPGYAVYAIEVLNRQLEVIQDLKCFYRDYLYEGFIGRCINKLQAFLGKFVPASAADLFANWLFVLKIWVRHKRARFIVHEPISAFFLSFLTGRLVIVYHQQGSLYYEYLSSTNYREKRIQKLLYTTIEKVAFNRAQRIYFPSHGAIDAFFLTSNLPKYKYEHKLGVLHSTLVKDTGAIPTNEPHEIEKEISSKLSGNLIFLSVSSLSLAKGVDLIPGFFRELAKHTNRFLWILVGEGALRQKIETEIAEYELSQKFIHVTEFLPNEVIRRIMCKAHYYIMFHRLAIFDLTILEAMSNGCVPILSRTTGNLDFDKMENVIFFHGDYEQLAKRVAKMTPCEHEDYRRRNIEVYKRHFGSKRSFLEAYRAVFSEIR